MADETFFHRWQPIEDLPEAWESLASSELAAWRQVWEDVRAEIEPTDGFKTFNERLKREWSIETGIIERVYSIDRGITQLLIEQGIDASLIPHGAASPDAETAVAMIRDHEEALDGLFAFVKGDRPLSTSYIKELHQVLLRHQTTGVALRPDGSRGEMTLRKGEWKLRPNSPKRPDGRIHEYCPPEQTAQQMERLLDIYATFESRGVTPEVAAAWLHHRFTQIHPFQDGNGRVARALASIVLIKGGGFPMVVKPQDWGSYIDALEEADKGQLWTFATHIARGQADMMQRAIVLARASRAASMEDAVAALVTKLAAGEAPTARTPAEKHVRGEITAMVQHVLDGARQMLAALAPIVSVARTPVVDARVARLARQGGLHVIDRTGGQDDVALTIPGADAREIHFTVVSVGSHASGVIALVPWVVTGSNRDGAHVTLSPARQNFLVIAAKDNPAEIAVRARYWVEDASLEAIKQLERET